MNIYYQNTEKLELKLLDGYELNKQRFLFFVIYFQHEKTEYVKEWKNEKLKVKGIIINQGFFLIVFADRMS